jgi:UDPglucose--hexose-1-phosphate uridylyltransferase
MLPDELQHTPHRRLNPLTEKWVLVSPQRTQRPWQGQVEKASLRPSQSFDPNCYLCPGNARAGGVRNPSYRSTFIFGNDFAALQPKGAAIHHSESKLLVAETERGICKVLCFSPRHDLTLSRMDRSAIRNVVNVWTDQYVELGALPYIQYVQIFENRGEMMGASNPHPHGQIWANETVPNEPHIEQLSQMHHLYESHSCMLCDYLEIETKAGTRIVCENETFTIVVPFWAVWPYEVLLLPKRHVRDMVALNDAERDGLADILKRMTTHYDNLFEVPFPYSMGIHQGPTDGELHPEWHMHAHFYPPLLRSATVRKFMVGYEMLASPQRDITPEQAAAQLRTLSEEHFLDR